MMTGLNNITGREFPAWEQSVSSVETGRSQRGNSVRSAGDARKMQGRSTLVGAWLRCVVMLLLMMTVGVNGAWGQDTDYSGIYYIANDNSASGSEDKIVYSKADDAQKYYLVPADNPQQQDKRDAWYSPNHSTNPGDPEKPFLTTYHTNKDAADVPNGVTVRAHNSVWIVKKTSDGYYNIIHAATGKYVIYEVPLPNDPNKNDDTTESNNGKRKTMHLQTPNDGTYSLSTNENFKFTITRSGSDNNYIYLIEPKNRLGWYWNPASGNKNKYYGQTNSIYQAGLVGVYNSSTDGGSKWHFEDAKLTAPTINPVNVATSEVTITVTNGLPDGYNIRYTFGDGTQAAPTATTGTLIENVSSASPGEILISESGVLKVVIERYGVVLTNVAISGLLEPTIPDAPTITENCDNTFSLSCDNISTAAIYYNLTTNGDEPDDPTTGSTLYNGTPIPFEAGYKVKAIAVFGSLTSTTISSNHFTALHPDAPVITLGATTATITAPEGATIYYTTDGTDPTDQSATYTTTITSVSETDDVDIRAIAVVSGKVSCVTRVTRPAVPTLTLDDVATDCSVTNQVTITGSDDGRTFWYAYTAGQNSAAPEKNTFTQYNGVFSLNNLEGISGTNAYYTVHAYAKSSDGKYASDIVSVSHQMKTPGTPTLTAPTGSSNALDITGGTASDIVVLVSDNGTPDNTGDDIDYTNTANATVGTDGTATFIIPNDITGTLHVSFQRGNWVPSCTATFNDWPAAPVTPTYALDIENKLSLHCVDPDPENPSISNTMAEIYYIIGKNGATPADPTRENGTQYNGNYVPDLAEGDIIKAIAYYGFRTSGVMTHTYSKTHIAPPQFFIDGTTVTITAASGATIYYTTDDSDPTDATNANRHEYDNAITITGGGATTTIKAYAIVGTNSATASSVVRVVTREGYSINSAADLSKLSDHPSSYFFILQDFDATGFAGTVNSFTGVLDGGYHTIKNLRVPLFQTITSSEPTHNADVHDLFFDNVNINVNSGNAGAVAQTATGYTRIYNCGVLSTDEEHPSEVKGSANVGSIVGEISGTTRVINCFSYANITGGDYRGGIVGNNNVVTASTWSSINTMVMNCMFYGDIIIGENDNPTSIAPIYGGTKISNSGKNSIKGLNNYNYFRFNRPYVTNGLITDYNCALGAEDRFLNRFEFFRQTLNSTRDLAAWYVSGTVADKELMAKWVLDKSIAPYPILKAPKDLNGQTIKYPSVMNPDAEHAIAIDADNTEFNKGRKLGTLSVTLTGTGITTNSLTLNITDKDPDNYNFNYKKVQLPYFNEVGTGNYTNNRVVTGWKIVSISGAGSKLGSFTTGTEVTYDENGKIISTPYNFADRSTYAKDLYSGSSDTDHSGRVFNQGAYWEVPDGVTAITIEPYWADCVYLADANYDVTYDNSSPKQITAMGSRSLSNLLGDQTVYTSMETAIGALGGDENSTVYDFAIVLVGNYHFYRGQNSPTYGRTAPLTIMSADFDHDNEPDYSLFYQHDGRRSVAPIRFDFLNIPGIGMAQKEDGVKTNFQPGIFRPSSWFEITNTVLIQFSQFEYADSDQEGKDVLSPTILQGGIYEQFISARTADATNIQYLLIGGNAWFKEFSNGCHTGKNLNTPKRPISVTGGDYNKFYLSGIYRPQWAGNNDGVSCYIDGGRFGEVAGAGMQIIKGNVTWLINGADIKNFYGGGINPDKPIEGNINTTISNSRIGEFCGGPKFGTMSNSKTVTTTASNCDITTFFGAGHGGTAFNRIGTEDLTYPGQDYTGWNSWVNTYYLRNYQATQATNIPTGTAGTVEVNAISTSYEYEYTFFSGGASQNKVARFYVNFASMDLANTNSVSSTLTKCKVGTFYGGGKMGAVNGDATSILTDCEVTGNVYGAGYSATAPTVDVTPRENSKGAVGFEVAPTYDNDAGVFNGEQATAPDDVTYTWDDDPDNFEDLTSSYFNDTKHLIFTGWVKNDNNEDVPYSLEGLGKVNGTAKLTINGKSVIGTANDATTGNVYGGGALSNVKNATDVTIDGRTKVLGSVFGGGQGEADDFTCDKAMIGDENSGTGSTSVTINNGTVEGNVYGGGEVGRVEADTEVTIGNESGTPIINGNVFGGGAGVETHGYSALTRGHTTVTIQGNAKIAQSVFGGGEIATVGRFYVKNVNDASYDHKNEYDVPTGMPYALISGGDCTVTVQGNAEVTGDVFGAGKGQEPDVFDYMTEAAYQQANPEGSYEKMDHMPRRMVDYDASKYKTTYDENDVKYVWEYFEDDHNFVWEYFDTPDKYKTFLQTLALVNAPEVTIGGSAKVKESVYGGSKSGFVLGTTSVTTQGSCTIGTSGTTEEDGNVFGGGLGLASFAEAGIVKGNTGVTINGGTVKHNIYGGGKLGSVGTYKVSSDMRNFYWTNTPLANINPNDPTTYTYNSTGVCNVTITGGEIGTGVAMSDDGSFVNGNVFGAGKGLGDTFWCEKAIVYSTNVSVTDGTVNGNVYGGGEVGRVETNATVTIGDTDDENSDPQILGNVFGGGEGLKTHGYSALVRGNTYVTVQSSANVGHNVYGGGQIAAVGKYYLVTAENQAAHPGLSIGMPYSLVSDELGICNVTIKDNATITGSVFGGGKGKEPENLDFAKPSGSDYHTSSYNIDVHMPKRMMNDYVGKNTYWEFYGPSTNGIIWEYFDTKAKYHTFLETLGLTTQSKVTIGGTRAANGTVTPAGSPTINGDVYGGSESGFVQHNTSVAIAGGTIGTGTAGGDVFGGGLGLEEFAEAGRVRGNATVTIDNGTINGNVYGGGEFGDVGTIDKSDANKNYKWIDNTGAYNSTGSCTVTITGGEIGTENGTTTNHISGHVFGAGKGADDTFWCEKAMAYKTNVIISNGTVWGNVYGGGEIGRVENNSTVMVGLEKVADGTTTYYTKNDGTDEGSVLAAGTSVVGKYIRSGVEGSYVYTLIGETSAPDIVGSVFGAGAGVETHGYSALVRGNTTVTVDGSAKVGNSVYGGGEIASVGKYGLDAHKMPEILVEGGYCYVKVQGSATVGSTTITGNVFGACKGVTPHFDKTSTNHAERSRRMTLYTNTTDFPDNAKITETNSNGTWEYYATGSPFVWEYFQTETAYNKYLETLALATHPEVTISGSSTINGSVFGGGEMGLTKGSVIVNVLGGTIVEDVYGGGALANSNTTKDVAKRDDDGNPLPPVNGQYETEEVHPTTTVNLLGGKLRNAYGGGLGRLEEKTGNTVTVSAIEAKVMGNVKVNLNGLEKNDYIERIHKDYVDGVGSPVSEYALKMITTGEGENAVTSYPKGAIVNQIFGCNNLNGSPKAHVQVHVFATQNADAGHNKLNLKYPQRPAQGDKEHPDETYSDYLGRLAAAYDGITAVTDLIDDVQTASTNLANKTSEYNAAEGEEAQAAALTALNAAKKIYDDAVAALNAVFSTLYDVKAVYGGGNLAAYKPYGPAANDTKEDYKATTERTEIIIDGCDLTSIETVYGGGNAASVPASYVRVNGTHEIEELFGGGNGKDNYSLEEGGNTVWYQNPGANVGYYDYTHVDKDIEGYDGTTDAKAYRAISNTTEAEGGDASTVANRKTYYSYGSGITTIEVTGGLIHATFGGSNTKGNIREKAESTYEDAEICPMRIDETYGGGKDSPMDAEIDMALDCVKDMDMIFGGSKNADVDNNITLNITNGTFQKVFGGNNTSGAINGAITVNIEERGCQPIEIEELYLGGYLAPYSVYGYKKTNGVYETINVDGIPQRIPLKKIDSGASTTPYNDPRLNVISATRIGNIFGGGYKATVVGNPYVNVNMTTGKVKVTKTLVEKTQVTKKTVTKRAKVNTDNTEWIITEGGTDYVYVANTTFYDPAKVEKDDSGESPVYYVYYTVAETVETVYDPAKVEKVTTNYYIYKDAASYYDYTKVITEGTPEEPEYYVYKDGNNNSYENDAVTDEKSGTLELGTIGNIYGGGNEADIYGSTNVEIGTGRWVKTWEDGYPVYETEYIDTDDKVKNLYYKEKVHAVYYTKDECNEYNATLDGYIASGTPLTKEQADAVNNALNLTGDDAFSEGNQLQDTNDYPYHYAYNATLAGARKTSDVKTPAVWAWYTNEDDTEPCSVTTAPTPTRNAAQITGNVFGGGKGVADNFTCDKAMVGIDGAGINIKNYPEGYRDGNTNITIANGTIEGNVYGGGEIGRVEMNTMVTIGFEGDLTNEPVIEGDVFGGGAGVKTHGYSALVRGNPTVIVQGNAKVRGNVYGGGEIASVARYKVKEDPNDPDAPLGWPMNMPYALKNANSGFCTVKILGYAEIGPKDAMQMTAAEGPDDAGHVFGAGKGILPEVYTYADNDHRPRRMVLDGTKNSIWEYFTSEAAYIGFIETLALASETNVTIGDHAFVKGSVYGGSMNGIVQYDTHVTIEDNCQIGAGFVQMDDEGNYLTNKVGVNRRYTDAEWTAGHLFVEGDPEFALTDGENPVIADEAERTLRSAVGSNYRTSLPECASWPYQSPYEPWNLYDYVDPNATNPVPKAATDGHTFYGNVFGGGSGYYPYRQKKEALDGADWVQDADKTAELGRPVDANGYSDGVWLRSAGLVRGNTTVDITGGHILTSVYGGNEQTDVEGSCTVNMSGGTLGVPRTLGQIAKHPVTCYLFGAGKGDPRINFNIWTNVKSVDVNITGGWIYGSVFGGGEDGHVQEDVTMTIGKAAIGTEGEDGYEPASGPKIGTWGTSYVEGNVFGGGRGFTGDAQTAGTVGGNINLTINYGEMLGSIYGGGRLASVGTSFAYPTLEIEKNETTTTITNPSYGNFVEDNVILYYTKEECDLYNPTITGYIPAGTTLTAQQAAAYNEVISGGSKSEGDNLSVQEALAYNKKLVGYRTIETPKLNGEHSHGHVTINISGGTIGNDLESIEPTMNNIPNDLLGKDIKNWTETDWAEWKEYNNINGDIPDGLSPTKDNITPAGITDNEKITNIKKWSADDWETWKNYHHIPNTGFELYDSVEVGGTKIYKYHASHTKGGNVFGGSMGRLDLLNNTRNPIWPKMAQVKTTAVNIYGDAIIKRSVYGGGELGTVRDNAYVTIGGIKNADVNASGYVDIENKGGGTVNWDVFGGGYGSDDDDTYTVFTVMEPNKDNPNPSKPDEDYDPNEYAFTPMQFAGCVGQNTYVHIVGGYIKKSVYGGGEMASVGIINCRVEDVTTEPGKDKIVVAHEDNSNTWTIYSHMIKHWDETNEFALSWPFEFEYVPTFDGATHVHITGGRIGAIKTDDIGTDNGDVYGAGKGLAGDYKDYVFCANVGSTDVRIEYDENDNLTLDPKTYKISGDCISGAVYGGGENGHVMGNAKLTLENGLVGHSIYGGGSGKGKFSTRKLLKIGAQPTNPNAPKEEWTYNQADYYTRDIYSITAGKVFGNTEVEMTGGYVVRNVYGGGNMGSVGKGNYAGGPDDYSTAGYGEKLTGEKNLWDGGNKFSQAFLNSGKCTVKITGGTIGYIDESNPSNSMYPWNSTASLPYGNVFGGCRGESAPNLVESPRYLYSPEFFVGYANETEVTIGKTRADFGSDNEYTTYLSNDNTDNLGTAGYAPKILGSVYGGGMDGHVRRDASVTINSGEIGMAYTTANRQLLKTITLSGGSTPTDADKEQIASTADLDDLQWLARGNVYGAGSGIGKYQYDFNYDGNFGDVVDYNNGRTTVATNEEDYSTSAGSVTRFTTVNINGGIIHRNVYGGGSLSTVGAPKIPPINYDPYRKGDTAENHGEGKQSLNQVNIAGTIGTPDGYGNDNTFKYNPVYGGEVYGASRGEVSLGSSFSNAVWTEVNLLPGARVQGNVFGGGDSGPVKQDSEVNVGVTFDITSTAIEDDAMSILQAGDGQTIYVTSNATWEVKSSASWLTVSQKSGDGNGTITVTATANNGEPRTATITISAPGQTKTISVTQAGGS